MIQLYHFVDIVGDTSRVCSRSSISGRTDPKSLVNDFWNDVSS